MAHPLFFSEAEREIETQKTITNICNKMDSAKDIPEPGDGIKSGERSSQNKITTKERISLQNV